MQRMMLTHIGASCQENHLELTSLHILIPSASGDTHIANVGGEKISVIEDGLEHLNSELDPKISFEETKLG